ncbi:hypothetical protein PVAP13_5NG373000 [Panicum virgatum]|uniref:Uncharacterized protein n=1 Tax=Panicum virgatum TaxID=38727 RepID=A0A8T0RUG3_PANVG|nr:hypothetical protein PVAP13_5NG373000 [Panicum virgatum]
MLAGEKFCQGDWSKIKKYNSFDEGELLLCCFSSAYIIALLHDTLKMPLHHKRINVVNQIHGVPVDWALGAFIVQTALNRTDILHFEVEMASAEDDHMEKGFACRRCLAELTGVQAAALMYHRTIWVAAAFLLAQIKHVALLMKHVRNTTILRHLQWRNHHPTHLAQSKSLLLQELNHLL